MNFSESAIEVLKKRYLAKDEAGNPVETPEGLFKRVAKAVAAADKLYDKSADLKKVEKEFFDLMTNAEFLPNSPTLMNAGRPLGQLSACFVLPVEDTMEGIFETIKRAAIIHKSGGGTGFSFSRIRPKGASVNSTGGVASGPISFMKVFNAATEAVKQGGTRRGANMGILRVDHPDIMEFISCKQDNSEITNFNISVGITEKFMQAVFDETDYELLDPNTKEAVGKLNATEVFEKIVNSAWQNGEPGIIFLDRVNRDNVVPHISEIESTNPCGEQPLMPYESCNLGSINLAAAVDNGKIDYDKLKLIVNTAVHFLDNVIDVNKYPIPEIEQTTKSTRKIGLGVMGFADMLYMLGVPYNSEEGVKLAEEVMEFIDTTAKLESCELAKVRGTFPLFEESTLKDGKYKLRNATVTTIAPTGTISMLAGVSSGVEPVFALSFIRNVMDNTEFVEVNPVFRKFAEDNGFYSDALMKKIANQGSLAHIDEISPEIKAVYVTAHEVSPIWHIKMQAAFQKHIDNAVSKTVNFSNEATPEDVREVFELAYELNCKGVTIYRDGSRDLQVLNIGKVKGKTETERPEQINNSTDIVPRPRPEITTGFTEKVKIGCGNLYITVNYDERGICEVFTNLGRGGGCPSQSEATSRLASIAIRSGIAPEALIEQLKGIRCPSTIKQKGLKVMSCPDAIGKVIEKVMKIQRQGVNLYDKSITEDVIPTSPKISNSGCDMTSCADCGARWDCTKKDGICPECGSQVEHEGGCMICRSCGYSKCG